MKSIRLRILSFWMLFLGIFAFLAMIYGIRVVYKRYEKLLSDTENYVFAQRDVQEFKTSLDFLTEQARQFVLTMDAGYIKAYFNSESALDRYDECLRSLKIRFGNMDTQATLILSEMLPYIAPLSDREIHSMRLIASVLHVSENDMPPILRGYSLTAEEEAMSETEKEDSAYFLIFSHEYTELRYFVDEKLSKATNQIFSYTHQRQLSSRIFFHKAMANQLTCSALLVALLSLSFFFISVLILRPIRFFVANIREEKPLDSKVLAGAELKYLASTYNNMYEMNRTVKKELQRQASYDAVSGLLNRVAFEQMCAYYKGVENSVALLIIDVDNFKHINDSYGHEIGDIALRHVSDLLKSVVGENDRAFRIGGDEFAIIMVDYKESDERFIEHKFVEINMTLQHPISVEFPRLSVSVGVSFSERGYSSEMYSNADKALYRTKENGRCGISFYTPSIDSL